MPYNGSGQFLRLYNWVTDAANGVFVSSSRTQADSQDMADNGLSLAITKDGQQTVTANIPFNGFKLVGVGLGTAPTDAATVQNIINGGGNDVCDFRLTLTTGVPVTTGDVTGATTIFCCPYKGNRIALYDGVSAWNTRTSAQFSIALGTLTSGLTYDVFCYDNSGVPTLEILAWSNATNRATSLVFQDGVYVKSGATTRRYLGSFVTTSTTQTEDSLLNRYLWNYYNRVSRFLIGTNTGAASWTYTTNTVRQANGSTAAQVNFVIGVAEDAQRFTLATSSSNTNASVGMQAGLGFDSTTQIYTYSTAPVTMSAVANAAVVHNATLYFYPFFSGVGKHFVAWLEVSQATGTTTWYANATVGGITSGTYGISGIVLG